MKKFIIIGILAFNNLTIWADEGMWLPYLLAKNEKDMQSKGLKISAEDIYSVNQSSLKDAVVLFGSGCTGEIISEKGLLLTNHHCGFGKIQSHSSLEHDYLTNGFWAMNQSEELPNPGLTVTLLISMEEVTDKVLAGITSDMSVAQKNKKIEENMAIIIQNATQDTHYKAVIEPIYDGNQYLLYINEIFEDVRLVGAPPSNIGKFGGDTDNWMWPRHTGDFSIFRIYTDKNGKPAPFSKDNIPYKPKKHLTISLKGVTENDFTFVFGYPGSTQQFIPSYAVELIQNQSNPIAIEMRTQRLNVIKKYMNTDPLIRIQYAAKAANISNGWKKWIGENKGLQRLDVIAQKRALEAIFSQWINQNPQKKEKYGKILTNYRDIYAQMSPLTREKSYFMESFYAVEIIPFTNRFANEKNFQNKEAARAYINNFFKDYNPNIDKEIAKILFKTYLDSTDNDSYLPYKKEIDKIGIDKFVDNLYAKSIFLNQDKLLKIIDKGDMKDFQKLNSDPLMNFASPAFASYFSNAKRLEQYYQALDELGKLWIQALMEMQPQKTFYPDANLTLRVTYGHVKGYTPTDGVEYHYYTTIDGIMQKENPEIYDYVVTDRLKELYLKKDYGQYADKNGELRVAFIADNHTTGGNSGSPVLNADGHLVGINFDRCWEGTMSDIKFDSTQCRNISLDIRYCLFIIDKYAGAKHLIDEMSIN
ncbi:MAG: S46 family peptidase [Bacteroidales bacterium]|jgi:hypothetical protein|nr:S46 family peptidase [Bacteroidales bacterium]